MQLSLYNVTTTERTLLVGLTKAQRVRFEAAPDTGTDLGAYLDASGYLAVWECRQLSDERVELVQPILLEAGAVVAIEAAPHLPEALLAA